MTNWVLKPFGYTLLAAALFIGAGACAGGGFALGIYVAIQINS